MLSKEEFKSLVIISNKNYVTFDIAVAFSEIIKSQGIDYLNNLVENFVEDGYMIEDLSYEVTKVEGSNMIIEVQGFIPSDFFVPDDYGKPEFIEKFLSTHKVGACAVYSEKELKEYLKKEDFESLEKFMHGQTCIAMEDGSLGYYFYDVLNWIKIFKKS